MAVFHNDLKYPENKDLKNNSEDSRDELTVFGTRLDRSGR